jgi:altronate dehydratase large subunit
MAKGYARANGKIGIRNHVVFMSTVGCANGIVRRVGIEYPDVIAVENTAGCVGLADDERANRNVLIGFGNHPNVAAIVYVGLGCEQTSAKELFDIIKERKKCGYVIIQEEGGSLKTLEKCRKMTEEFLKAASDEIPSAEFTYRDLVIGSKCGDSDWTTGMISNPAVGIVSDRVVEAGGTSLTGETSGWFGAEEILMAKAVNNTTKRDILAVLKKKYEQAEIRGTRIEKANPSIGNIAGGLSTLAEKAAGTVKKCGNSKIQGLLGMGVEPPGNGLWLLDNPAYDVGSTSGLCAAGAHMVLFTTGRGTPLGSPICPILKICASPTGIARMGADIDVNISSVVSGSMSISGAADMIEKAMNDVITGKKSFSEELGNREFLMPQHGIL